MCTHERMPHKLVSWEGGGGARCCKRVSRCSSTVNIIIIGARAGTAARNDWLFYLVWYSMVWYGYPARASISMRCLLMPMDAFDFISVHFISLSREQPGVATVTVTVMLLCGVGIGPLHTYTYICMYYLVCLMPHTAHCCPHLTESTARKCGRRCLCDTFFCCYHHQRCYLRSPPFCYIENS